MVVDILHSRNLFLKAMCAIYMFAFLSLYLQIPGLYGENGVLPAHAELQEISNFRICLPEKLTLLCFAPYLGLNISYMMELISLVGIFLSFLGLVWKSWCSSVIFLILWAFYFSLYQVGQTFLWFQWDSLLLEIGFLTILVAPFRRSGWNTYHPRNLITMWLIRWALFRLMFASGVVKLQSDCPSWWGLTALNVHYESQCLPTPLAWFMHQLPTWWHKLSVVATYVIEIAVPFFFFSPVRSHRIFSCYCQLLLQVMIILTGNYNFFNLLTIALCISLVDDVHLGYKYVKDFSFGFVSYMKSMCCWVTKWIGYGALIYYTMAYFAIKISPLGVIESSISFSRNEFSVLVAKAVPISIALAAFSLVMTIAEALTSAVFEVRGFLSKFSVFSSTLAYSLAAVMLFGISLVPFTVLDRPTSQRVWPVFHHWYSKTSDFHLCSSYGLFRQMTGIGGRPEVVLEGANSVNGPWTEYDFLYKPGNVNISPQFIIPHQPRLDWQMWFAALGNYNHNPWLISLAYRLLAGQEEILKLLDPNTSWRDKPPKYIRGIKYTYQYTSLNRSQIPDAWWVRSQKEDYMPIFTVDHAPLIEYLRKLKALGNSDIPATNIPLVSALDNVRLITDAGNPLYIIWGLLITALVILRTRGYFR